MTSSPLRPGSSLEEELGYYKRQYEQLETDLADFQASSKELEEQLEKDIDAAEKNERKLKEQVEKLGFEVEEWKAKYKQSKTEGNNAQNALQKEITTMREQNRSLQLKLRDIEVANDDYERQARNTTSSLEDLESKLNMSIERGVLIDEEIRNGESEREALRIENQRLRDELGDLKVESEITLEKLRLAGKTMEQLRSRKPSNLAVQHLRATSPGSEASGITPTSPTASTPPHKSDSASEAQTPPSPPLSDEVLANGKLEPRTPMPMHRRSLLPDAAITPRPSIYGSRGITSRHSRGPSVASTTSNAASDLRSMRPPASRAKAISPQSGLVSSGGLPRSESLYQMKSLRSRMQKIEERVHSARSKLPAPRNSTTPKASPRSGSALGNPIPSSITVRRTSKRPSSAATSTVLSKEESAGEDAGTGRRESQSHIKRLSYGLPRPPSRASTAGDRPPSRTSILERPPSAAAASRPGSRLSFAGAGSRPESRSGARTDNGHSYTGTTITTTTTAPDRRPRSSMSGNYNTITGTPRTHRPSASISELRRRANEGEESAMPIGSFTPQRRTTLDRGGFGLPAPTSLSRRQSNGVPAPTGGKTIGRRTSIQAVGDGGMRPPPSRRKMSEVPDDVLDESELGETY